MDIHLGEFYFKSFSNAPPILLQLIGWTKKAELPETKCRYVYVRRVPMTESHSYEFGTWEIDPQILRNYSAEITSPVYKTDPRITGAAILVSNGEFLRFQRETVPRFHI